MISLPLLRESTPAGPVQTSPPSAGQSGQRALQQRLPLVLTWGLLAVLTLLSAAAWAAHLT